MTAQALHQLRTSPVTATLVTILAAMIIPLLVHLIPPVNNVPMGARLLPIFYAPLLAVFLFKPGVAVAASLVTPFLNYLLTSSPTLPMTGIVTLELVVFSAVAMVAHDRLRWTTAIVALLIGKLASMLLLFVLPVVPVPPAQFFINGLVIALPGIVILLLLNVAVLRFAREQ